jgi:2-polyprenyl-3-methyl-5-hydroxy-6-metoxy-1,4-benzoquinol methylase
VQHDDRHALRVAALLDIDPVPVAHVEHPLVERVDRRIEMAAARFWPETLSMGTLYTAAAMPTGQTGKMTEDHAMNRPPSTRRDRQVRGDGRRMVGPARQVQAAAHAQPLPAGLHHRPDRRRIRPRPGAERPFAGLRLLDIGCGGGLLSEPMARLGAEVVGADAAARNIPVARVHAEQSGLEIDYRHTTAEAWPRRASASTWC